MWSKIKLKLRQHPSVGKGFLLGMLICGADAVSQLCNYFKYKQVSRKISLIGEGIWNLWC